MIYFFIYIKMNKIEDLNNVEKGESNFSSDKTENNNENITEIIEESEKKKNIIFLLK